MKTWINTILLLAIFALSADTNQKRSEALEQDCDALLLGGLAYKHTLFNVLDSCGVDGWDFEMIDTLFVNKWVEPECHNLYFDE